MLNLILGRAGYGKTDYCFNKITALAKSGNKDILLLTPEQYNFTAEKKLLSSLGESMVNNVQNLSFTRLSNELKRLYGGDTLPVLSKGAKAVLMKKAMESVKDELQVFSKKTDIMSFISSMVDIYDEMKSCSKSWQEIKTASENIDKKLLSGKLGDISKIIEKYEQMIDGKYYDTADEFSRLYAKLAETSYLKRKTVFIDGFNGFVANEIKILELIIKDASDVYITLATDSYGTNGEYDLFAYINKTASSIISIAENNGVPYSIINLTENHRTHNRYLLTCEKEIFSQEGVSVSEKPDSISIYKARSISDECDYVALKIRKLLRSGYKAREIAVICRDAQKYRNELSYAFRKYEIPFFDDERQNINAQPVIAFVRFLLRTVTYFFRSEDILSLAKTGLTALDSKDINSLENYIYMWGISGVRKWGTPFVNSAKGFSAGLSDYDKSVLDKLNESREYLYSRLNRFKKAVADSNAAQISEAIYNALIAFGANKKLKSLAGDLNEFGKNALADEQKRVWDLLMEILNDLAVVSEDDVISVKDYAGLFSIMVNSEDLGVLPQGIDCVQFGQADRMRADNPKAVFVVGANEGDFPKSVFSGGLLTESDRVILSENDFALYSFGETLTFQERYFAYMALSVASEKLIVSYEGNVKNDAPSSIITSLIFLFPNIEILKKEDIPETELVESRTSAFELMTEKFGDNTAFSESLKKYFEDDGRYEAVKLLFENDDISIKNKDNSKELFGKDMYLSASRLEDYFNCRFRYFCKFGLMARPLQKAQMNAMQTGTVIHYVLENVLNDIGTRQLANESEARIRIIVNKYLNMYFETQLGDTTEFTKRFRYQFMRLSKMLYSVVLRLADEFSHSSFSAEAFELTIDKDGDVQPAVIQLEDGSVRIRGAVDRVDILEKNGEKYIRVVDYKSGNKKFKLSDVLYGLNLQMFVYLFTICSDKKSKFCGIPAGVLYMHASKSVASLDSQNTEEALRKNADSEYKMKGVVLYDDEHDILNDMEEGVEGRFIPVSYDSKGNVKGCFASLEGLGRIARKINSLIAEMGNGLHNGEIGQNPIDGKDHDKTCEYCDYSDVCANRKYIDYREMESLKDAEVISALEEVQDSEKMD